MHYCIGEIKSLTMKSDRIFPLLSVRSFPGLTSNSVSQHDCFSQQKGSLSLRYRRFFQKLLYYLSNYKQNSVASLGFYTEDNLADQEKSYRCINISRRITIGICQHRNNTNHYSFHRVNGKPAFLRFFIAVFVFSRLMKN